VSLAKSNSRFDYGKLVAYYNEPNAEASFAGKNYGMSNHEVQTPASKGGGGRKGFT